MATLRQAILDRMAELTRQIENAKTVMANTIAPLQAAIDAEQNKMATFSAWLDREVSDVQTEVAGVLAEYDVQK